MGTPTTKAKAATTKVFKPGTCHHRSAAGAPDCSKPVVRASAHLCDRHQREWAAAAKARTATRKATAPKPAPKVVSIARKPAPRPKREPVARAALVAVEPEVTRVK